MIEINDSCRTGEKPAAGKKFPVLLMICFLVFAAVAPALSEAKEQATVETQPLPTLIDLGKGTCTPCKMMAPILDELKKEYAGVLNVTFIDIRHDQDAVQKYNIRGIPTQIFYDASGKELSRHYGFASKEQLLSEFKRLGIELMKAPAQKVK